jgi:hypothetical protein
MTKPAALYARVSSDRQKENHTIVSQLAALMEYGATHEYTVSPEWRFWSTRPIASGASMPIRCSWPKRGSNGSRCGHIVESVAA